MVGGVLIPTLVIVIFDIVILSVTMKKDREKQGCKSDCKTNGGSEIKTDLDSKKESEYKSEKEPDRNSKKEQNDKIQKDSTHDSNKELNNKSGKESEHRDSNKEQDNKSEQKSEHEEVLSLQSALALIVIFGLTSVTAFLTVIQTPEDNFKEVSFDIIFVILNSIQGFFMFVAFCLSNRDTILKWIQRFCGEDALTKCTPSKYKGHYEPDDHTSTDDTAQTSTDGLPDQSKSIDGTAQNQFKRINSTDFTMQNQSKPITSTDGTIQNQPTPRKSTDDTVRNQLDHQTSTNGTMHNQPNANKSTDDTAENQSEQHQVQG